VEKGSKKSGLRGGGRPGGLLLGGRGIEGGGSPVEEAGKRGSAELKDVRPKNTKARKGRRTSGNPLGLNRYVLLN